MKDFIIGVDSGGTTTIAKAYDLKGQLITRTQTGFGNLLVNESKALEHLKQAINTLLDKLDITYCKGIVFGIAGIDTGGYKQLVYNAFKDLDLNIVIMNDAWLAHYALLAGEDGCLLISGTGSVALGRYNGKEARVGGWGHLLGDAGSGYAIAKHLIQDVLAAYDTGREWSPLENQLFLKGIFTDPFEMARFVYHSSKDQVADLSKFIAKEAEKGDKQAIAILKEAGVSLGIQVLQLFQKLDNPEQKRIAVTGSVLVKNDIVYQAFQDKVLSEVKNCEFIRNEVSNTIGAFYYFKKNHAEVSKEVGDD